MADKNNITLFAYGTNILQEEMKSHSPTAVFIGYGELLNFRLVFQGFQGHAIANIKPEKGVNLPIAIYDLTPADRFTIDNFEKFPYAYERVLAKAILNGKVIKGFVYLLKLNLPAGVPNDEYLKALRMSYFEADFDDKYIDEALREVGVDVPDDI